MSALLQIKCNTADKAYEGSGCAISILSRVMAMIPCASILHCPEGVIETVSRRGRALSDTINTVHVHGQPLSNAVPMNAGSVVFELVVDDDSYVLPLCQSQVLS